MKLRFRTTSQTPQLEIPGILPFILDPIGLHPFYKIPNWGNMYW